MSRLSAFISLSRPDRWLTLEALACLGFARGAVVSLPFRWVASLLGQPLSNRVYAGEPLQLPLPEAQAVARAIARVQRHTPWHSNCLAQGVAGLCMLRRRGVPGTLYLGMTKNPKGELEAHAWLRSGSAVLTGGGSSNQYTVLAAFAVRRVNL